MRAVSRVSRRDFIKLGGLGLTSMAFSRFAPAARPALAQFPQGDILGRVAVTPNFYSTRLMSQPNENATAIRNVAQDEVVVWLRDVVGSSVAGRTNRRWAQTPDGFIYAADLQPVRNLPDQPLTAIPGGKRGFWAEVTVQYVDLLLQGAPISPGIKYDLQTNQPVRLYYGQVIWVDQIGAGQDGTVLYRVNEDAGHGYGYGDLFYAEGAAFHALTDDDVAPINPHVDPASKKIVVDATPGHQMLSCLEGNTEVYFCRVSTGYGETFSTPTGDQSISWKIFSIHMAANTGSDSGYDTMAVPWPVFFNRPAGAAIHGTFWHNDFGVRRSHGCVNVSPEDAKWIFRWSAPFISLDQSEWREDDPSKVGGGFSTDVTVNEEKA
jgi:hypothetical protein